MVSNLYRFQWFIPLAIRQEWIDEWIICERYFMNYTISHINSHPDTFTHTGTDGIGFFLVLEISDVLWCSTPDSFLHFCVSCDLLSFNHLLFIPVMIFNSLWPSDAVWCQISWSILMLVMTYLAAILVQGEMSLPINTWIHMGPYSAL